MRCEHVVMPKGAECPRCGPARRARPPSTLGPRLRLNDGRDVKAAINGMQKRFAEALRLVKRW